MGPLYVDINDLIPHLGFPIITIGDVVTSHFETAGVSPNVSIIDQLTKREPIDFPPPFQNIDFHIEVKNPPGVLTDELVHAINQSINNPDEPSQILVTGEEDLATLPAIMLAPLESSIIYGQPDLGMVHILVTPDARHDAWDLLSQFDGDLDSVFSMIAQSDL